MCGTPKHCSAPRILFIDILLDWEDCAANWHYAWSKDWMRQMCVWIAVVPDIRMRKRRECIRARPSISAISAIRIHPTHAGAADVFLFFAYAKHITIVFRRIPILQTAPLFRSRSSSILKFMSFRNLLCRARQQQDIAEFERHEMWVNRNHRNATENDLSSPK